MLLRSFKEGDLPQVLTWRNAPEVRKYMYTSHEISWDEHKAWFRSLQDDSSKLYFIFQDHGIDMGVVCFTEYKPEWRSSFWGFFAGISAPKGTGIKMEYCALEYAFENLGLHKLNCEVLASNKSVVNMHKKAGFVEEGYFRDAYYNGEDFVDVIRLSILESGWQESKKIMTERIKTQ